MANAEEIRIEVAYALPERAHLIALQVRRGTTIREGIELSGLLQRCPEIDLAKNQVGIFGKLREPDTVLNEGDRIEIYRPLKADPKEARRKRAEKKEDS
jgi:putative ubiquitin-RnfH superfamily antitoxin RatB of RatAB toxin-antitoxin module